MKLPRCLVPPPLRTTPLFPLVVSIPLVVSLACGSNSDDGPNGDECAASLLIGDLVITEVMANPAGEDRGFEWFEIYNASSVSVDLSGLELIYSLEDGTEEKSHTMGELVIEPSDYIVVATAAEGELPAFADYAVGNALGTLRNGGARLALACGGELIDETLYPSAESGDGVAWGLDGNVAPDHIANDSVDNYCKATVSFAPESFGSPGDSNEPCNIVVPGMCTENAAMRPTVAPVVGDLVISEFLADPDGSDGSKEWFEVYVTRDVDLNGVTAGTVIGSPKLSIGALTSDCVTAKAGDYLLFARTNEQAENAGLPMADVLFNFTLKNGTSTTGPGGIFIGLGGDVLDAVSYETTTPGASTSLDPSKFDPTGNDDATSFCDGAGQYGTEANLGTPRAANDACPVQCAADQCFDGDECRERIAPGEGDIWVTEALPNPLGTGEVDPNHEWFELIATASFDLSGVQIGKGGTLSQVLSPSECSPVEIGDVIVIAHSSDDEVNGGLPGVDFVKSFQLTNSNSSVEVGVDDVVLHSLSWSSPPDGKSFQFDDLDNTCVTPETTPYSSSGNLGSPGLANLSCPP